jgi:hypothetical protein
MPAWIQGLFTVTFASKRYFMLFSIHLLAFIPLHIQICNLEIFANFVQPLMDNLEARTYETFEKDAMKYIQVLQCMNYILNFTHFIYVYVFSLTLKSSSYTLYFYYKHGELFDLVTTPFPCYSTVVQCLISILVCLGNLNDILLYIVCC